MRRVRVWQEQGFVLKVLLWFWVIAFLFVIIASVLGIEPYYNRYATRFASSVYAGTLIEGTAWLIFMKEAVIGLSYFSTAIWLVVNYSGRGMPLLAAYALLCFGFMESSFADAYVVGNSTGFAFLSVSFFFLYAISTIVIVYFIILFPNGEYVPKWSKYYSIFWVLLIVSFFIFPNLPFNFLYAESFYRSPINYLAVLFFFAIPISLQIYRYFYVSSERERQQSKWLVFGICSALFGAFWDYGIRFFFSLNIFPIDENGVRQPLWLVHYGRNIFQAVGYSIFPFTLLYALSKNNFWRTDQMVRRTLIFSASTLLIIVIYSSIVGVLSLVFQQRFNFFTSVIGAAAIAILFHPLRRFMQRMVSERLYGQRDDPYKVLTGLSKTTGSQDSLATLQEIAESTAKVLKLPYVAVKLNASNHIPVASFGEQDADGISLTLHHETAEIGQLELARRAEGEVFSSNERLLLSTIAQQVSIIAHNYLLTQALQASREKLVLSREEERKRIRRDLHDGLGPTLASTALQLETAQDLIYSKPEEGASILKTLEEKMTQTLSDVRALVHDLYPTAIDQLGLHEALRTELASFESAHLGIQLDVKGKLENLPAAVEVAVYRIVMEAVHNVRKHADATSCTVSLKREAENLTITIKDDGIGMSELSAQGVGLHSIRERAEELGGHAAVKLDKGTIVSVTLPIKRLE